MQVVADRRAAIDTHLFLLCPNNSGSTFLGEAIKRSQHVWGLPREGQHVLGFAGPSTRRSGWPLIWAATEQSRSHFEDGNYDWERTKIAWYFQSQAAGSDSSVFFTKSPPFLLIAQQLTDAFENSKFLIMVRDPYAALEGILRRHERGTSGLPRNRVVKTAATHLVQCLNYQARNRARLSGRCASFSYEEMCADPIGVARQIEVLVPELDDLDLAQRQPVKGIYDEPLRNMNDDAIARLAPQTIRVANEVFAEHQSLLEAFDYALRD